MYNPKIYDGMFNITPSMLIVSYFAAGLMWLSAIIMGYVAYVGKYSITIVAGEFLGIALVTHFIFRTIWWKPTRIKKQLEKQNN